MDDTTFTEGPWIPWLDEDTNKFSVYKEHPNGVGEWIAEIHGTKGHYQANAHLIATAPDMYDVLIRIVYCLENGIDVGPSTRAQARTAINKVRGKAGAE